MTKNAGANITIPDNQNIKIELLIKRYAKANTTHETSQIFIKVSKFITTLK